MNPFLDMGPDGVAQCACLVQAFFGGADEGDGIREVPVFPQGDSWENRGIPGAGLVADGDGMGEEFARLDEGEDGLGAVFGDIDADFAHYFDGHGVEFPRFKAGAIRRELAAKEVF